VSAAVSPPAADILPGVISFLPGSALWDVAGHAAWLAPVVIAVTAACAVVTPVLVALCWRKPGGPRCIARLLTAIRIRGHGSAENTTP
jgi:hypothetical protein